MEQASAKHMQELGEVAGQHERELEEIADKHAGLMQVGRGLVMATLQP